MVHYDWSYIALLYSQGSYGEKAAESIERGAKSRDICIGYNKKIPSNPSEEDMLLIIKKLRQAATKVVIMFAEDLHSQRLAKALNTVNYQPGEFIFLGGDNWGVGSYINPEYHSAIFTGYLHPENPEFVEYYGSLTKENNPENPWYQQIYDYNETCAQSEPVEECYVYDYLTRENRAPATYTGMPFKGVETIARALDSLIRAKCASVERSDVRRCIKGPDLLESLYDVDFELSGSRIRFDDKGDIISEIALVQFNHVTKVSWHTILRTTICIL